MIDWLIGFNISFLTQESNIQQPKKIRGGLVVCTRQASMWTGSNTAPNIDQSKDLASIIAIDKMIS